MNLYQIIYAQFFIISLIVSVSIPPQFNVNLNEQPNSRWNGSISLLLKTHSWNYSFGAVFNQFNKTLFDNLNQSTYILLSDSLKKYNTEFAQELQGISEEFKQNGHYVSFEYLSAWVWFHELGHTNIASIQMAQYFKQCTAIVSVSKEGKFIHGRNMDNGFQPLANLTLKIKFNYNNKTLFEGVDWYWFTTGVVTAMKSGVISLQENWLSQYYIVLNKYRRIYEQDLQTLLNQIQQGLVTSQLFMFRIALSDNNISNSYENIVSYLSNVFLATPCYIAWACNFQQNFNNYLSIALKKAGVLTRYNDTGNNTISQILTKNMDQWYLIQTNTDFWLSTQDNDPRRYAGISVLNQFGQEAASNDLGMLAAISTSPITNEGTVYTAIMNPQDGYMFSITRNGYSLNYALNQEIQTIDSNYSTYQQVK